MATRIELPQMTDTMTEGTLLNWLKHEGEQVHTGDPIAEVETDKAVMEIESPEDGVLLKILVPEGETIPCGTTLAIVGAPGEPIPEEAPTVPPQEEPTRVAQTHEPTPSKEEEERVKASPVARKMAEQAGIDLRTLSGTGPGGRIVRRDVEAALAAKPAPEPTAEVVPIERIRRRMIEKLIATHQTVPTFTVTRRVTMDAALELREALRRTEAFAEGIGVTELLVKAAALAMEKVPALNARFTEEGIRRLKEVNIGIAVGKEEAVIVPVIRRCHARTLRQIAEEFRRLTEKAERGSLLAEEMEGSTFTISNLGMYGVEQFTAILNAPDAAILAVGTIMPQPIVRQGEVTIAQQMAVTLTVDHRVADGVTAARWLAAFAEILENPIELVVHEPREGI